MRRFQQAMALFLPWCLLLAGVRDGFAYQGDANLSKSPPQAAQQSPDQLQQLVAPIALYPDGLIAQILPAATYPAEIVDAQRWMDQHKDLKGDALAKEIDKQSWDPSVKALTQFPAVLANMNQNLAWTSELGADGYCAWRGRHRICSSREHGRRPARGGLGRKNPQPVPAGEHSWREVQLCVQPSEQHRQR